MNFQLIDIINSISCFQLVFFSFFLIHKGRKQLANLILTLFFIVQLIVIGLFLLSNLYKSSDGAINLNIFIAGVPCWFLFGPLMNFYIRSLVEKDFKIRAKNTVHLIPFFIGLIFIFSQYCSLNCETKQLVISNGSLFQQLTICSVLQNLQVFIYNTFSLVILIRYQKGLKNYCSLVEKQNLLWLKIVLYGYLVPCIFAEINSFAGYLIPISYESQMLIEYSLFLIFFNILFYKAMLHPYVIVQTEEKPKYFASNLDNNDIVNYSKIIEDFVNTKKPYLNPSLTLGELSEATGIPEKYISQVINQYWKQNFYTYINSLRVKEAKRILKTKESEKSTMFGIACDSGFNSKTVFYEAFKKYTGMTPSDFRKQNL
jgi:AraC-like DNA-binding protein